MRKSSADFEGQLCDQEVQALVVYSQPFYTRSLLGAKAAVMRRGSPADR
jgi:hypothetical protein